MPSPSMAKIFHHIPKCAGTAFRREFLAQNFRLIDDYRDTGRTPSDEKGYGPPIDEELVTDDTILCGHFEGRLIGSPAHAIENRYPIANSRDRSFVFTIFRDPLEMAVSMFYYEIRLGVRKADPNDYDALVKALIGKKNYVSRLLHVETSDSIDSRLDMYSFIGITERYAETCSCLAGLLGVPFIQRADYANKTRRSPLSEQRLRSNFEYVSGLHREGNLDYQIYNRALDRLSASL